MAKFTFDKSAKKKAPKPITETKISKPKETYNPAKMTKQVEAEYQKQPKKKRPVGRPRSGRKSYQTVRLQKKTVLKIDALENALSIKTQDETVNQAIGYCDHWATMKCGHISCGWICLKREIVQINWFQSINYGWARYRTIPGYNAL